MSELYSTILGTRWSYQPLTYAIVGNGQPASSATDSKVFNIFKDHANFQENISVVPWFSSVLSDISSAFTTTFVDTLMLINPTSSAKPFLEIGNLGFITALTAPIKLYFGSKSLQKAEDTTNRFFTRICLVMAGMQLVKGLLQMTASAGSEIAKMTHTSFPIMAKGMSVFLSSLSFVFYSVIIVFYTTKLSKLVKFGSTLSKIENLEAKREYLFTEYENNPTELKHIMGDKAFRNLENAVSVNRDKIIRIEDGKEVRGVGLGIEQTEKLISQVIRSNRIEMAARIIGLCACGVGITSLILAAVLSGTPALITTIILSIVGAGLWLVADSFTLWNSLQNNATSAKKVMAMTAIISAVLVGFNFTTIFTKGVADLVLIGGTAVIWAAVLSLIALRDKFYKSEEAVIRSQEATKLEKRECA